MYSRWVKCVCGGGGGGGGGLIVRQKTTDGVSFWESEFLTHPMISVFKGLSFHDT